jgi:hypothetical protein
VYIATSKQLKRYDQALLDYGYSIEELVDKASDCLIKHFHHYRKVMIVCGPGNNGADGISLGIKLFNEGKEVLLCYNGFPVSGFKPVGISIEITSFSIVLLIASTTYFTIPLRSLLSPKPNKASTTTS